MNEFDVSIFVVTKDGQVIEPQQYIKDKDNTVEFIMITNDRLNPEYDEDCTIYIHRDWKRMVNDIFSKYHYSSDRGVLWSTLSVDIPNIIPTTEKDGWEDPYRYPREMRNDKFFEAAIKNDLNGYQQTLDIILNADNISDETNTYEKVPAAKGAHEQVVYLNNKPCRGYLPSIGQLVYISNNIMKIKQVQKQSGIYQFLLNKSTYRGIFNKLHGRWWSSNMWYRNSNVLLSNGEIDNTIFRDVEADVLPLFKIQ